ncbi:MAG: hypothetical protein Q9209_000304 [Squamulea sp. 1 TL-2023]
MPRPKRTKLAPSIPIVPFATASRKPQPGDDVSPAVSSSRGTNGSDDSEGVVSKSKTGVNRRGIAPQAVFMSGALAVEDVGTKKPRPVSSRKRVELSRIAREGDYTKAHEAVKKGQDASIVAERPTKTATNAKMQIQSIQIMKPPSALVAPAPIASIQPTPMRENSVLTLDNFKRRPRQPSILQLAQAHNAAAELEIDDTLDDFNPDDESTPFRESRAHPQKDLSSTSSRLSSSRKRKLSAPESQVPASQNQSPPERSSSAIPSQPDDLFDIIAEDSQPNPPLPTIPTRTSISATRVDSDTMAPPQSSSLHPSPQQQKRPPQLKSRTKKGSLTLESKLHPNKSRVNNLSSQILPPRSPSPTQSSPTIAPKAPRQLKPLTTSALQNLLPRRRRVVPGSNKENTVFDLNTSSDIDSLRADEDQDELSYHASSKITRKPRIEKPKNGRTKEKGGKKAKANGTAAGTKMQWQAKKGAQKTSMTYTRKPQNAEAHDENESGGESGEAEHRLPVLLDGKAREEMKKLAAKFREVDDWGLEFEEVTGSSDRMQDAR